jgi:hypothetical protein
MKIQVYRDGRVIVDGVVIAHTNNPQEVLRRLLASRNSELVLDGRACCFPGGCDATPGWSPSAPFFGSSLSATRPLPVVAALSAPGR